MANITIGLQENIDIVLKAGTAYRNAKADVVYIWEPFGGGVETGLDGTLSEEWLDSRLVMKCLLHAPGSATGADISTDWLLNTFFPSKDKGYKESGFASYIDVVLVTEPVDIAPWKNNVARGLVELVFKKKTLGLTT